MGVAMENNKRAYIVVFTILLLNIASCNSQNVENKKEEISTQKINSTEMNEKDNIHNNLKNYILQKEINLKEFNTKREGNSYSFIDNDGMEVEQTVNSKFPSGKVTGYFEYRKYPNSAYEIYSEYSADGKLTKSLILFHGMEIGFMYFYNTYGEIISKEDLDVAYKFSVDNLINKMKTQYDIDIVDTQICVSITRGIYKEYNNSPLYCVEAHEDKAINLLIYYVVDGNTGETLFTTNRYLFDEREAVTDEYFNSLKEKE